MSISTLIKKTTGALFALSLLPACALANAPAGDYAWDKFLNPVVTDLSSNVVLAFGILAVVACGLYMAFNDLQGGAKWGLRVGLGLSIALSASSILTKLFSTGVIIH